MKTTQLKLSYLVTSLFVACVLLLSVRQAIAATVSCTSNITSANVSSGDDVVVLSGNTCTSIHTLITDNINSVTINSGGTVTNTTATVYEIAILISGGIGSFLNNGSIYNVIGAPTGDNSSLYLAGTIYNNATIINNGYINNINGTFGLNITPTSASNFSISNSGTITSGEASIIINSREGTGFTVSSITNTGYLQSSTGAGIVAFGDDKPLSIGSIYNSNTISSNSNYFGAIDLEGISVNSLTNTASGVISGYGYGVVANGSAITTLANSGTITVNYGSSLAALYGSQISNIVNSGIISNTGTAGGFSWNSINDGGSAIYNSAHMLSLTNTGSIYATATGAFGIYNNVDTSIDPNIGQIDVLNNAQGAGNARGSLTYTGKLPTNYNIIINSPSIFGRLAVTSGTGSTTFGIYTGSTVQNNHNYSAVLSGVSAANLVNTSGTYGGFSWALNLESGQTTIWDLCFGILCSSPPTGPSTADTQQSLVNTAAVLQNTFALQNAVLSNSFSYDCNTFGENNVCVSAGGRNTAVSAANGLNNTSALLIAAYRPHPNYRIGAYADQNLSVSNPGGTVNLGNNTPLMGLFGAWNERLDGTGTEVKVSAAYGQKNATVSRSVVGSGATASEAGSGASQLNSQGAQIVAKYGFAVADRAIVAPYLGMRYTQNNMNGYTEGTSATVTAPLTYSALNTNATTALAGVGASYRVIPAVTTFASAGVETDTNTANGTYSGTSSSISGLTPVNFNANPVKTRPTATLGAYYDVAKNQRLGLTGIYRQEAYQAVSTTTVMATYTIGL